MKAAAIGNQRSYDLFVRPAGYPAVPPGKRGAGQERRGIGRQKSIRKSSGCRPEQPDKRNDKDEIGIGEHQAKSVVDGEVIRPLELGKQTARVQMDWDEDEKHPAHRHQFRPAARKQQGHQQNENSH